jgi:hypothetical protein
MSSCQGEDSDYLSKLIEKELGNLVTYETLSDVTRYAVDRCIDKVRNGEYLARESFDNGEVYCYKSGGRLCWGVNSLHGNIARGVVDEGKGSM